MKSILQTERQCFFTGRTDNLHSHHVFGGSNRKNSERYGLKVYLTAEMHNMGDAGIHFNKELDTELKQFAQKQAMNHYGWSIEDFRGIFGKNYL